MFSPSLAITISFVLATSQLTSAVLAETRDSPANPSCSVIPTPNLPKHIRCGVEGSLAAASEIALSQNPASSQDNCFLACLLEDHCRSFSFTSSSQQCRLFKKTLKHQSFSKSESGESFFQKHCFQKQCDSTGSSSATTTTDSTTTTTTTDPTTTISLPTTPPASVYSPPPIPTSYSDCVFDLSDPSSTFSLLDADGVPFVNIDGRAAKPSEVLDTMPQYTLIPYGDGSQGLYDVMLDNKYLAADTEAEMIFVDTSTGPNFVTQGQQTYITTIFSYTCDGKFLAGIPGIVPFEIGVLSGLLYAQPIVDQYNPPASNSKLRQKRTPDDATRLAIAQYRYKHLDPLAVIVAPKYIETTPSQMGQAARCPNTPTGLVASVKSGARGPIANGCGSADQPVPDLVFGTCCNNHDLCYDNCDSRFSDCNDNFRSCNHAECDANFPGFFLALLNWGCHNLADFYANVVAGYRGVNAFVSANNDRCTCSCPPYTKPCGNSCRGIVNDPFNCGDCDTTCSSSSFCDYDHCYVLPPPSNDPCDPTNFYYYSGVDASPSISNNLATLITVPDIYDKQSCCNACYTETAGGQGGCLGYYLAQTYQGYGFYDTQCKVVIQTAKSSTTSLSTPLPECPYGGSSMAFSGLTKGGTSPCDNCLRIPLPQVRAVCEPVICKNITTGMGKTFYDAEPGNCAVV